MSLLDGGPDEGPRDGGHPCPAGLDQDLAEVESIVLDRLAQQDETIAGLREHVRCLEGLVGSLAEAVAAQQLKVGQCEGFIASLGSFSKLLAGEADRLDSSS